MTVLNIPFLLSVISFFTWMIYLYFGIQVFRLNTSSKINITFFALCISLSFWALGYSFLYFSPNESSAWFWYKISCIGIYSFDILALQFFYLLTKKPLTLFRKLTYAIVCIPLIVRIFTFFNINMTIKGLVLTSHGWKEIYATESPFYLIHIGNIIFCVSYGLYLIYAWGRKSSFANQKQQSRFIFIFGLLSLLLGGLNNIVLPMFQVTSIPYLPHVAILLFVFGISYAIRNFGLMNLSVEIASEEIVSGSLDLLILMDLDHKIIKFNKTVQNVLGFTESELYSKNLDELIFEKSTFKLLVSNLHNSNSQSSLLEMNFVCKDNKLTPVKLSVSLIKDKNAFEVGYVCVAHDLRLAKQLQIEVENRMKDAKELSALNERLKEVDNLKSDFLSTVSHELRTPLTSVLGFAKIIKKKLNDIVFPSIQEPDVKVSRTIKQITENVSIIITEGERLTFLINDVLDIEKMEAGKLELKYDYHSIVEIIEKSLSLNNAILLQKPISIVKKIQDDIPLIYCDKDRIIQVMTNLVSNALKFAEKGSIVISVFQNVNYLCVSVEDEGIGISEENLSNIFEKFKQVGDTLTDKPKGSGLGLPICKKIVEYHQGNISATSTLGIGTKVMFSLPIIDSNSYPSLSKISSAKITNLNMEHYIKKDNFTILIVDDEEPIRKLLIQNLSDSGYSIYEAEDGLDGIMKAKQLKPDIIILDILMQKMNGFDAATVLKNDPATRTIPIIMLSIVENKSRGILSGGDYFLTKPVDMEELLNVLEKITSQT